jgi:hypothetical protein
MPDTTEIRSDNERDDAGDEYLKNYEFNNFLEGIFEGGEPRHATFQHMNARHSWEKIAGFLVMHFEIKRVAYWYGNGWVPRELYKIYLKKMMLRHHVIAPRDYGFPKRESVILRHEIKNIGRDAPRAITREEQWKLHFSDTGGEYGGWDGCPSLQPGHTDCNSPERDCKRCVDQWVVNTARLAKTFRTIENDECM